MRLIVKGKVISFLGTAFFSLFIIELVIGGGGRITSYGSLSLRMLFFTIAFLLTIGSTLFYKKIERWVAFWLFSFLFLLLVGTINGLINSSPTSLLLEDLKPLFFFFMLPYFAITISDIKHVDYVIKLIKISSMTMAISYLLLLLLLFFGKFNYVQFYNTLDRTGEVFFRGQFFFFYKGFLYLCIGLFFFWTSNGKSNRICSLIMFSSVVLTLTRGFILMVLITLVFYYLFIERNKLISIFVFIMGIIIGGISLPYYINSLGDKSTSDEIRFIAIEQVVERINPFMILVGHGFGQGIPIRPDHMEITYLEIFHKQGILGLLFWISILVYSSLIFISINRNPGLFMKYSPLYLTIVFVFMQSATNPFLNNPIGLSAVLICLVCLKRVDTYSRLI